jgi:hypothetical protein
VIELKDKKNLSVFLVESMSASDLYNGLLEAEAIAQILRLLRVDAVCRTVVDRNYLSRAIQESMERESSIFHLSCHAGQDGFDLTAEENLSWIDLSKIAKDRLKKTMFCISGCEAGNIATAEAFRKHGTPPPYIVGPETEVGYAQACVAWSVFYHYLAQNGVSKKHMQYALDRMNQAVDSKFLYRRWTGKKYLRYPSQERP